MFVFAMDRRWASGGYRGSLPVPQSRDPDNK